MNPVGLIVTTMTNEDNLLNYLPTDEERKRIINKVKARIIQKQFNAHDPRPMYDSPVEFQVMVDNYFENDAEEIDKIIGAGPTARVVRVKMPTITGLCESLGFCSRQTFYDYEKEPGYKDTVKKARQRIERMYEQILIGGSVPTGAIFALKNLGWIDKTEQTINQTIKEVKVSVSDSNVTPKLDNI